MLPCLLLAPLLLSPRAHSRSQRVSDWQGLCSDGRPMAIHRRALPAEMVRGARRVGGRLLMCADGAHLVKQSALSSSSVCEMAFLGHTNHRNIASAGHAFVFANTLSLLLNVHECVSLKDVMQAHPLHEEHVAEVCIQLLRALDYLHRRNIVHGNLEPESILIDRHGYAHLINFERAVKAGDGWRRRVGLQDGPSRLGLLGRPDGHRKAGWAACLGLELVLQRAEAVCQAVLARARQAFCIPLDEGQVFGQLRVSLHIPQQSHQQSLRSSTIACAAHVSAGC